MLRIALKSILGRKARLVLTSLSVIIGTAFLAGSSIFSATLTRTFDNLFQDVFKNIDGYVRSANVIEGDFGAEERQRIPASLLEDVLAVEGVRDAAPDLQAFARIIGKDGTPLGSDGNGPPTFGSIAVDFAGNLWTIEDGRYPSGPDEVALDRASAENGDYVLGDTVKVVARAGSREFTLVGIASYGEVRSPGGATFALFDPPTASEFLATPGVVDSILVVGDGTVSDEELVARISAALPADAELETITGAQITEEVTDQLGAVLGFFSIFLTIFSVIALGVGSFVIYNVFSIGAAQRERENALLRAIGATKGQVARSLLAESVVTGVVGSALGLVGGIGLSRGLGALLAAFGIDLPTSGLVVSMSTVQTTLVVGVLVTVGSALMPALRAGRVPPLAAMRASILETAGPGRLRTLLGVGLFAAGIGAVVWVTTGADSRLLGVGIFLAFVGTLVLGPVLSRPVAMFLGAPAARLRGVTGTMARENAARNPKRTARTAAPVLIGVALVTAVSALAASIRGQITDIFTQQFKADFAVTAPLTGFGGFSPSLADEIGAIDGVGSATGIGTLLVRIDGRGQTLTVVSPETVGDSYDIGLLGADYGALGADDIFLSRDWAERKGFTPGETLEVVIGDGTSRALTVSGLYEYDDLAGNFVVARSMFAGTTAVSYDFGVFAVLADGADADVVRSSIEAAVADYGQGKVLSQSEYIDEQAGQVNQLLALIYGLLALSVVIAVVGIVITLLLSVLERRREIGLLRAVGMTRGQVRTTVRWESVITSLIGAVTGIVLGLGFGWVIVFALRDEGLTTFHLPIGSTVTIVITAFIVGVLAAVYPARRATKVNILEALTTN